jgi:hypothetical protein
MTSGLAITRSTSEVTTESMLSSLSSIISRRLPNCPRLASLLTWSVDPGLSCAGNLQALLYHAQRFEFRSVLLHQLVYLLSNGALQVLAKSLPGRRR